MLSDYETLGKQSGVTVKCDKPCRVLTSNDWEIRLENIKDSIVFIDEGNKFIRSEDFARAIQNSDNYYVLITRENLYNLPYSVEEIYEMHPYRHSIKLGKVYNGTRRFYSDIPEVQTYLRDVDWIREADFVIADISIPSIGVGYEIGFAESIEKPILCIYDKNSPKVASMMITGNQNIVFKEYETIEEANKIIDDFMET